MWRASTTKATIDQRLTLEAVDTTVDILPVVKGDDSSGGVRTAYAAEPTKIF